MAQTPDDLIHRLLDLLQEHATMVVSGTKMADEIGVPRSTLHGWIDRLRDLGVELKGVPATGYQLVRLPDILTPRAIRAAAQGTAFGQRAYHFFRVGSTMDEAAARAAAGDPHGTIVVAEEQTAGRGRLGRSWYSEKAAGLYLSIVLRPTLPAVFAPLLTLACGLAAAEAVADVTHNATDVRWPNDVLLDGRKCAGLLLEMTAEPERIKYVIVGMGFNVNQASLPEEVSAEATSMRMTTGAVYRRSDLLSALLRALDRWLAVLSRPEGRAEVVAGFERCSSFARGRRVRVEDNGQVIVGTTEGLDPSGYLLVRRDGGSLAEPVYTGKLRPE